MKSIYKDIVKAIYTKSVKEDTDVRDLIKDWIMMFESSRVIEFDREEFLDTCVDEVKKRNKPCVICGKEFIGYGNNAKPLAKGRCCDKCNEKVIMDRLRRMKK